MTHAQQKELSTLNQAFRTVGLNKAQHERRNYLRNVQTDETNRLVNQLQHSRFTRNATLSPA